MQSVPLVPKPFPPGERWRSWVYEYPRGHTIVEAWRKEWRDAAVIEIGKMPPWMNVAGLYWRPIAAGGETVN